MLHSPTSPHVLPQAKQNYYTKNFIYKTSCIRTYQAADTEKQINVDTDKQGEGLDILMVKVLQDLKYYIPYRKMSCIFLCLEGLSETL